VIRLSEPPGPTFRDPDRPLADRVADLLGRLTLAEKVALLHQYQAPVPRLGVAGFRTGTEVLHGLAWLGPATVFPQAVGLASTWNPELVRAVGSAVGDETRAFHHKDPSGAGLNVWAPVVNPLRDPRWGRNEEGYAEDPWLTGVMATAYAQGLRGDHPRLLKTAPTLKHFLGYNNETDRDRTSSNLPPRVLHEYELPAFAAPLAAGAAVALMPSYNLVNGRPAHLSPLINEVVRGWAPADILVVSDAGAPGNLVSPQHYHADHAAGYAAAVKAGLDSFTQDDADPSPTIRHLAAALDRGLLAESDVDAAVRHVLAVRFQLGEFDPAEGNPYAGITEEVINCPAHQALAREAARQSIVLLRNDGLLPLRLDGRDRVAVIGPLADAVYEDWYSGTLPYAVTVRAALAERLGAASVSYAEGVDRISLSSNGRHVVAADSPDGAPLTLHGGGEAGAAAWFDLFDWGEGVDAVRAVANGRHVSVDDFGFLVNDQPRPNGWVVKETFRLVERSDGVAVQHVATGRYVTVDADGRLRAAAADANVATAFTVELVSSGIAAATAAAQDADVAVVVVGNHPLINGRETEDRADLTLPAAQEALVRAVHAANPRTILALTSSYPFAVGWADTHLPAVLWSAHGGQESGHALADVLFGDADPAGRLTQTWYQSVAELPDLFDYDIVGTDSTYLYYRGTPLYPFGHGLSYTTFEYRDLRVSAAEMAADSEVAVSVDVVNTGDRAGDEVVQLYTRQLHSRVKQPVRQLRGFRRVRLAPGERTTVTLPLRAADLAFWDVTRGRMVVEAARHRVLVGRSATGIALTGTVSVRGEQIPDRDPYGRPLWSFEYDDYAGIRLLDESASTSGDVVAAAEPGAWISFEKVDFGTGAASVRAVTSGGPATLTLRLDDPLDGPVAGRLDVPRTAGRYAWVEAGGDLRGAAGRHDLYLVFDTEGTAVSRLTFSAKTAGAAGIATRAR
jgi:beta-glucosidase